MLTVIPRPLWLSLTPHKFNLHEVKALLEGIGHTVPVAEATVKKEIIFIALEAQFSEPGSIVEPGESSSQVGHAVWILTIPAGDRSEGGNQDSRQAKKKVVHPANPLLHIGGKASSASGDSFLQVLADRFQLLSLGMKVPRCFLQRGES